MDFLQAFLNLVPVTLAQSLVYALLVMGIMIPIRLVGFPDLTCEGSFPLGGCVCAALLLAGWHPVLATLAAIAAGVLAGALTALVNLRFGLSPLLAGIVVFTALYSINLRVLGQSNVALFDTASLFQLIHPELTQSVGLQIGFFALLVLALLFALRWYLRTESGAALRVVGVNADLAPSLGISDWTYTIAGLALANGLVGLGGALIVQQQGFVDVGMGLGVLINGLASLVIGEALTGRKTITRQLAAPVVGSILYFQLVSLGLSSGLKPGDLKLVTAVFVLITLGLPAFRARGQARETIRV
ncbi:ABC transporter permease [Variovorax boronicumulans]|uniref:ABC transporter permease n=1 Tax=Variovorax boronicumulans TaxID=436515 RepID=UPI00214AB0B9